MVVSTRPPESATEGEQDSTSHQSPHPTPELKTIRVSAAPRQGDGELSICKVPALSSDGMQDSAPSLPAVVASFITETVTQLLAGTHDTWLDVPASQDQRAATQPALPP